MLQELLYLMLIFNPRYTRQVLTKHWCGNSQQRRVTLDDLKPNIAAFKINVESPQTTSNNNHFFMLLINVILMLF